ncbi:unnamed protein product [Sphagnum balticum]
MIGRCRDVCTSVHHRKSNGNDTSEKKVFSSDEPSIVKSFTANDGVDRPQLLQLPRVRSTGASKGRVPAALLRHMLARRASSVVSTIRHSSSRSPSTSLTFHSSSCC